MKEEGGGGKKGGRGGGEGGKEEERQERQEEGEGKHWSSVIHCIQRVRPPARAYHFRGSQIAVIGLREGEGMEQRANKNKPVAWGFEPVGN